jgi:hypothetical protein
MVKAGAARVDSSDVTSRRRHLRALAAAVVIATGVLTGCGAGDDVEPASPVVQLMNISAGGEHVWFAAQHRPSRHPDGDVRSELCIYVAENGPATAKGGNAVCQWEPLEAAAPLYVLVGCEARVSNQLVIGIVTDPSLMVLRRGKDDDNGQLTGKDLVHHKLPSRLHRRGYWFGIGATDRSRLLVVDKRRGRDAVYLAPREGTLQLCSPPQV